jgi:hypothetical protein
MLYNEGGRIADWRRDGEMEESRVRDLGQRRSYHWAHGNASGSTSDIAAHVLYFYSFPPNGSIFSSVGSSD